MSGAMSLGPGAEFDAIRAMVTRWGPRAVGIGDDAATIRLPRGDALVASVDTAVEGRHFRREWLTPREIGYRAVAAALSDLAAMAARPVGILVAINAPPAWRGDLESIADGIGDAADIASSPILGGNLTDASELSITTTVFGAAFTPLERRGARAGDRVYVTGRLGGPGEALRRLLAGEPAGEYRARFAHPEPRIHEARWLAERGASAAIDISDGLLGDLQHLASASAVTIEIDGASVPCMNAVEPNRAMESGEEYELIVTAAMPLDVAEFETRFGLPLTEIGAVVDGPSGVVRVGGERVVNASSHDHFSS